MARLITERVSIPTIGIGAGRNCDGQVQVFHDMLGLFTDFVPKHAKRYADLGQSIAGAVAEYISEVKDQSFPAREHSYHIKEEVLAELQDQVR